MALPVATQARYWGIATIVLGGNGQGHGTLLDLGGYMAALAQACNGG